MTYGSFISDPLSLLPSSLNFTEEKISLKERLRRHNNPLVLDFLISANADILSHVGSQKGFEGADEAAKYYQRNLRIYSNLNRLKLFNEDRIFILSGASHAAFLNEFMNRSFKYELVDPLTYIK